MTAPDPAPAHTSPQSGTSRYVIANDDMRRVTVNANQWGLQVLTERDMDTNDPITQSVFIYWTETELLDRIITKHRPS